MSLTPEVFQRPMDRLKALAFKNIIPGWATPLQNIRKHFRYLSIIPSGLENKKYQRNDGPDTHVGCSRCIPWADLFVEVFKSFKYLTHVLGATSSREMYSFRFHWYQRENGGKPFCKTRRSRQRDFFWFPTCKGMFTAKLSSFYAASSVGKCPR